jgi:hypothetical protein
MSILKSSCPLSVGAVVSLLSLESDRQLDESGESGSRPGTRSCPSRPTHPHRARERAATADRRHCLRNLRLSLPKICLHRRTDEWKGCTVVFKMPAAVSAPTRGFGYCGAAPGVVTDHVAVGVVASLGLPTPKRHDRGIMEHAMEADRLSRLNR